jgi:hypothetical protein
MKRVVSWATTLPVLLLLSLSACSDSSTSPADAPEGHTILKGGVPHAVGLNDPTENCATCHGATLQGGNSGEPSCYSCHGKTW